MSRPEDRRQAALIRAGEHVPRSMLPPPARHVMDAARAMGATFADLDNGGGYLFRVAKNGRAIYSGGGGVCSYPINAATPVSIARDKAHTKTILHQAGLPYIPGGLFFAHRRRARMRGPGREVSDALSFADHIGYPVFCKPNTGGRGNFAEIISDREALEDFARRVAIEFETFLVEPVTRGTEHRVLIKDGYGVYHAVKAAPMLIGDGQSTCLELLQAYNRNLEGSGVSAVPFSVLELMRQPPDRVLNQGEPIQLPGRRNLHAMGAVDYVSLHMPHHIYELARQAVAAIGLRIGAVDFFDVSPMQNLSQPVIIEVNGNPGLEGLERAGRSDVIRHLWIDMLSEFLGR